MGEDGTAFAGVDAVLQDVDVNCARVVKSLKGNLDLRGELAWSSVDRADYGSGAFSNRREGGYLQAAYRPTLSESPFLSRLEGVVRYDFLDNAEGGPLPDEHGWTAGVNYYTGASSVAKLALQQYDEAGHAFLFQFAVGF
jgi:hypothetical protein